MNCFIPLLTTFLIPALAQDQGPAAVKAAVARGLERIQAGVANYPKHRKCFSCHHQAMAVFSLTAARQHGFPVAEGQIKQLVDFSLPTFKNTAAIAKGQGVGGESVSVLYALQTLAVAEHPPDATTAALVDYLLVRQHAEGHWVAPVDRPPTMGSPFTNTGLAMAVLKHYAPPPDQEGSAALRQRSAAALEKARAWLLANQPVSTEDRVFHLRGLVDAGAEAERITQARDGLLAEQRDDGSWAQLRGQDGDAYATATALVALRRAGLDVTHGAYRKGVQYLMRTQREDGAWVVQTRARPVQVYFDNGDAGGKAQFISFAATGWAVMALLETLPVGGEPSGKREHP
jgi:N-acyl-D-amino-acid deacylase